MELQDVDLNAVCRELRVEPTSSFLDRFRFDAGEDEDPSTWYSAKDGIRTFSALAKHLPQYLDGRHDIDPGQLRSELDDVLELLTQASQANLRFHVVVVIIPPGMEHVIEQ